MDIFSLFHLIEGNMPLTRQKIEDIGFVLVKTREKDGYTDYIATPVDLNDGAKLVNIDLWERNDESGRHIFFILDIKNRVVTRKELENHLGSFALLPDGDITLGKTAIYEKIVRGSEFSALYTQAPQNILLNVSFSSIEPLEQ